MKRRTLDSIVSYVGLLATVVLLAVSGLAFWGYSFANTAVHDQLIAQNIYFPEEGEGFTAEEYPDVIKWAGQQVVSGDMAQGYADKYIKSHLDGMSGGKTYSEVSAEWIAGGRTDDALAQLRMTMFMGETLRGLLLNAYAFWQIGQIALIAAGAGLIASVFMGILTLLGFRHAKRVAEDAAI
jgi:hypothetical protein